MDVCGGHAGRSDDCHYHAKPTCMIANMSNAGENLIMVWGFDGFPIYGDANPDGSAITDGCLGVCNGQAEAVFGHRYHSTDGPPYFVQCLMGKVADFDALPSVRPLRSVEGAGATSGRPPRGGVDDLVFRQNEDGSRSMDYTYQGLNYYIRYSEAETSGCYLFETHTVSNDGEFKKGELCR